MAKINLVELAIHGISSDVLAKNIASMNPSMILASRIINGVETPTKEQTLAFLRKRSSTYKDAEIVSVETQNSFCEQNMRVEYRYPRTVYWNQEYTQPEDTAVVSYDDYREMDRKASCSERQHDSYQHKMTYWYSSWDTFIGEDIIGE